MVIYLIGPTCPVFLALLLVCQTAYAMDYFIDSQEGSDENTGTSAKVAWASHTKLNSLELEPGDHVYFKAGSRFSGPIHIKDSGTRKRPILLSSYGRGPMPRLTNPDNRDMAGNCIRLSGSWIVVEKLHFHDTPPTGHPGRLRGIFMTAALLNMEGAEHNVIRHNRFTKCTKGIQSTGEHTYIHHNYLDGPSHALSWKPGWKNGWGPMGIQVGIGNHEIAYNTIKNYHTKETAYESDGGAIELDDGRFHKKNIYIHHNRSEGNAGFIEASWMFDNNPGVQHFYNLRVAFNVSYDYTDFLFLWAPCHDCYIDNNTAVRSLGGWTGVALTFGGINFRNNVIVFRKYPYLFTHQDSEYAIEFNGGKQATINEENNWYSHAQGDPGFVDSAELDFRLTSGSGLRGKGTNLSKHYSTDFEGKPLPKRGAWDIGAIQYAGAPRQPGAHLPRTAPE